MNFARSWGVPDVWPLGSPPAYNYYKNKRDWNVFSTESGHYAHSQMAQNDHNDPGAIDINVILAKSTETVTDVTLEEFADWDVSGLVGLPPKTMNMQTLLARAYMNSDSAMKNSSDLLDTVKSLKTQMSTGGADPVAVAEAVLAALKSKL